MAMEGVNLSLNLGEGGWLRSLVGLERGGLGECVLAIPERAEQDTALNLTKSAVALDFHIIHPAEPERGRFWIRMISRGIPPPVHLENWSAEPDPTRTNSWTKLEGKSVAKEILD